MRNDKNISTTARLPPVPRKIGSTQKGMYIGFKYPSGVTLAHPMADLLLKYAEDRCKVDRREH